MATVREWALKMIPVLVRWAQGAWDTPHYYSDLSTSVGLKTNQIGDMMGVIQDIIDELSEQTGERIPTLNGLVRNKQSGLPSDGFDYVIRNYSKLSVDSKKGEVKKINETAHQYDWNWVLRELELKPAIIIEKEKLAKIKNESHGYGGEGKEHKALKEFIAKHPECIGVKNVLAAKTEFELLSGDRLDVYFECHKKRIAVEVKPSSSPDGDILRGVFQCVKYQAVMDAARVVDNDNYDNEVILVTAGKLSPEIRQIAIDLHVKYFDLFKSQKG